MRVITKLLRKGKNVTASQITKQQLAVRMGYQILTEYRKRARTQGGKWSIYRKLRGVMLADEVGMGKTYEALALATRLYIANTKTRRENYRILILVAPAIQSKWSWCGEQISALEKCSELCQDLSCGHRDDKNQCRTATLPDKQDVGIFLKNVALKKRRDDIVRLFSTLHRNKIRSSRDWLTSRVKSEHQAIFLAGLQTLERTGGRNENIHFKPSRKSRNKISIRKGYFDLIIADEAHIARTGVEQETVSRLSTSALRKIKALLNNNPNAKLVLLTATPFQNHVGEFKRLLELLEYGSQERKNEHGKTVVEIIKEGLDGTKREYDTLIESLLFENVKALYRKSELDHDADDKTNYRPKQLKIRSKKIVEGLDDYLRDVMIRNRKDKIENIIEEIDLLKVSQPASLHYLLMRDLVGVEKDEREEDESPSFSIILSELVSSAESMRRSLYYSKEKLRRFNMLNKCFSNNTVFHLKQQRLLALLKRVQSSSQDKVKPVVTVFFRYLRTIDKMKAYLQENGIRNCYVFTGSDPKPMFRKERLEKIKKECLDFGVLLVSQVGNEGLDFDKFSNTIIHYDGHFNPAVIDQRNGRVYRRKATKEEIRAYRLQLKDTYDERITNIEMEKRKLKDFYLGDKTLGNLLNIVAEQRNGHQKAFIMKQVWERFTIDLEPKEALLI